MQEPDERLAMPQPCDEWSQLIVAAEAAGREAARQLAQRSPCSQLGRRGTASIEVTPIDSPVAAWLYETDRALPTATDSGVVLPLPVTAEDLAPAANAAEKAHTLRIARAYASAYATVLEEEAGVTTEIHLLARLMPLPQQRTEPPARSDTRTPLVPPTP
ncbi:hypothetical protein [Salinifilum ghardaiensis]